MATAVPEGVNFSGCLQGIESCCLTWAQLSPLLGISAGARICYKRWQSTKSGIIISNVKLAVPVVWQTPSTCWVLVSPSTGWVSPKDLLALAIRLNFLVMLSCPLRKPLVSPWPSSPLLKEEIWDLHSGLCLLPVFSSLPKEVCWGKGVLYWCLSWTGPWSGYWWW